MAIFGADNKASRPVATLQRVDDLNHVPSALRTTAAVMYEMLDIQAMLRLPHDSSIAELKRRKDEKNPGKTGTTLYFSLYQDIIDFTEFKHEHPDVAEGIEEFSKELVGVSGGPHLRSVQIIAASRLYAQMQGIFKGNVNPQVQADVYMNGVRRGLEGQQGVFQRFNDAVAEQRLAYREKEHVEFSDALDGILQVKVLMEGFNFQPRERGFGLRTRYER